MAEHEPESPAVPADQIAATVASRVSRLRQRFPDRYDDAQWEKIARSTEMSVHRGIALRRFDLGNHDEPDPRFVVCDIDGERR